MDPSETACPSIPPGRQQHFPTTFDEATTQPLRPVVLSFVTTQELARMPAPFDSNDVRRNPSKI